MPRYRGLSLIDVVIGSAIFLIAFLAVFAALRTSLSLSVVARTNVVATELANSQIEYMRGFSYDALGTVGGIPSGTIPQTSTTTVGGTAFVTRTLIEYVDDPADGLDAADANHITTDYKKAKISVTYTVLGVAHSVVFISTFAPPTIESSTNGGTLSLHVVNASGIDLTNANIQIVNTSIAPPVNFTVNTDSQGLSIIGGAATSTQYQIFVSQAGYSSAQTYARTAQNVNPTPGYLTVVKDTVTSATFVIDLLSSLTLSSVTLPTTAMFFDTFANASYLSSQNNTTISSDSVVLDTDMFSGTASSIPVSPSGLLGWGMVTAASSTPSATSVSIRVTDGTGNPLPDSALPGNGAGFTTLPILLNALSTSTYPTLALQVTLTRVATSSHPSLDSWSLSHTDGLFASPSTSFTLTGAKTIGTDGSGHLIYKTTVSDMTNTQGTVTKALEWDSYSLALSGVPGAEQCPAPPYSLQPGGTLSATLQIGSPSITTLPIQVEDGTGNPIPNASVFLSTTSYAAHIPTDACGVAFFNSLSSGTYSAIVSAPGHATTTVPGIVVAGHTATSTITLP